MKLGDKLLRVGLFLLIMLSLYFTFAIWLSPSSITTPELDSASRVTPDRDYKKATAFFLPIRGVWVTEDKALQTNSENVIRSIQSVITEGSYSKLQEVASGEKEFDTYLNRKDSVELYYEGYFLVNRYVKVFDVPIDLSGISAGKSLRFSKVQLDLKEDKLRFLNYKQNAVYETTCHLDKDKLKSLLESNQETFDEVQAQDISRKKMTTKSTIKLKKYSYILSSQPYTLFQDAFFQNTEDVKSEGDASDIQIFRSGQEELTLDEKTRVVHFDGVEAVDSESEGDIFAQSFNYVSKLGSGIGNLRYFDCNNDTINYRIFVEGYPIFDSSTRGRLTLDSLRQEGTGNRLIKIETSMDTIQVPIPSDEEIELPETETMMKNLVAAGADPSKITSYIIGYTWHDIQSVNRLVDLMPEWYIKYDNEWHSFNDLIASLPEKEAN